MTLTAIDEWGNKATGYTGAKRLVWSGPSSWPSGQRQLRSAATTVMFTAGEGTATLLTLYDAQSTTLKATEGSSVEGAWGASRSRPALRRRSRSLLAEHPDGENTPSLRGEGDVQDAWQNAPRRTPAM